ncbi:MAG: hypothetical protein ACP5I1_17880, partial [Candidatus Hinthialibacter sp.]
MAKSSLDGSPHSQSGLSFSTRAIHAGESRPRYADSMTTPIFQTSTFTFRNSRHIEEYTKE